MMIATLATTTMLALMFDHQGRIAGRERENPFFIVSGRLFHLSKSPETERKKGEEMK